MPRMTFSESGRVTTRDNGRTLYFRTQRIIVEPTKLTLVADPTDPAWDKLNYLGEADTLRKNLLASTRKNKLPPAFIPECSTRMVVIGFRGHLDSELVTPDLLEALGFSQPKSGATAKKRRT